MTTLTIASASPATSAPDLTRRGQHAGPADSAKSISAGPPRQGAALPWGLLIAAVGLSLGSNVFAALQLGHAARSVGGIIYGAWPTLAFLATAWLWHRQASQPGRAQDLTIRGLVWILRLAVAVPAAYVSLIHVHETALHFGQPGLMSWAEAVGMEAVTALALVELSDKHDLAEDQADDDGVGRGSKREILVAAIRADQAEKILRTSSEYADQYGTSRQYVSRIQAELRKAGTP